jgi:hypothetical protein
VKKLLLFAGIVFSINFYAASQHVSGVFEVSIDAERKVVVYTQHYGVEADSVQLIAYKFEALDRYLEEKQPAAGEIQIIEDEKTFLASERMRILMAPHPERKRE